MAADESCAYEPVGDQPRIEPAASAVYGAVVQPRLVWNEAARGRMERIPSFVRGVVVTRVEEFALARGYAEVTPDVLTEVRASMPIDFSRRRPFFLGGEDA